MQIIMDVAMAVPCSLIVPASGEHSWIGMLCWQGRKAISRGASHRSSAGQGQRRQFPPDRTPGSETRAWGLPAWQAEKTGIPCREAA